MYQVQRGRGAAALEQKQKKAGMANVTGNKKLEPITRVFEEPHGRATYTIDDVRGVIVFEGDCTAYKIMEATAEDRRTGQYPASKELLVDLTRYIGTIDWDFVRALPTMPHWVSPEKIACVMDDQLFQGIGKILSAFMPGSDWRFFGTRSEALIWLGWNLAERP